MEPDEKGCCRVTTPSVHGIRGAVQFNTGYEWTQLPEAVVDQGDRFTACIRKVGDGLGQSLFTELFQGVDDAQFAAIHARRNLFQHEQAPGVRFRHASPRRALRTAGKWKIRPQAGKRGPPLTGDCRQQGSFVDSHISWSGILVSVIRCRLQSGWQVCGSVRQEVSWLFSARRTRRRAWACRWRRRSSLVSRTSGGTGRGRNFSSRATKVR